MKIPLDDDWTVKAEAKHPWDWTFHEEDSLGGQQITARRKHERVMEQNSRVSKKQDHHHRLGERKSHQWSVAGCGRMSPRGGRILRWDLGFCHNQEVQGEANKQHKVTGKFVHQLPGILRARWKGTRREARAESDTGGGGEGQEAPKMLQKRETINTGTKRDKQDRGRVMMRCPWNPIFKYLFSVYLKRLGGIWFHSDKKYLDFPSAF